jgi:hypothetical protein
MADYMVTLGYGAEVYKFQELTADTVGLAVILAADKVNMGRPETVKVRVLHKPPRTKPVWIDCHVNQAVLDLIPVHGLESKGLA